MEFVAAFSAAAVAVLVLLLAFRSRQRRTHEVVRKTQRRLEEVASDAAAARKEAEKARRLADKLLRRGEFDYSNDCLQVWDKNPSFMDDPVFIDAYRKGMFSGQKLSSGERDQDLHIEWRVHVICWAAAQGLKLDGDFVECGVNTGMYALAIYDYLDFEKSGKLFYLFDTYEGIPADQISEEEKALDREQYSATLYEDCYEMVKANFAPYPSAKLVKGRVPESLQDAVIDKVAYLSIDMNVAEPEVAAMEYYWDRLVPGAVVVLDDYGWKNHGTQKDAMDSFAKSKGVQILLLPTGQGIIVKL